MSDIKLFRIAKNKITELEGRGLEYKENISDGSKIK